MVGNLRSGSQQENISGQQLGLSNSFINSSKTKSTQNKTAANGFKIDKIIKQNLKRHNKLNEESKFKHLLAQDKQKRKKAKLDEQNKNIRHFNFKKTKKPETSVNDLTMS